MHHIDLDQAPLYELCATGASLSDGGRSVAVYLDKTSDDGEVTKFSGSLFQDDPCGNDCFPCYALFLDSVHALAIRPVNRSGKQPQVLTTELVRDRTETELPNWGWRYESNMVRLGIVEFATRAVGDEQSGQTGDWSEDVVSALSLDESGQGRQMVGPASKDDVRISVLIK
jgi:hypothetical protein